MHRRRKQSLAVSVGSIIEGSAANVTSIGRGIKSSAKEKHNIKRADRLLSNVHLQSEAKNIYQALAKLTVGRVRLPNFYSIDNQSWQSITQLYAKATTCPKSFTGKIARSNPLDCQLVIYE